MKNGYMFNDQIPLFHDRVINQRDVIGYKKGHKHVQFIPTKDADQFIKRYHYSKSIVPNRIDSFGYFVNGVLYGVLQFGHMLHPASFKKYIPSTRGIQDYRELNRMFLFDEAPKNSASQAISFCIKVLHKKYGVKWVQSFADERCGKLGIVYQAANFHFFGSHVNTFYTYQGRTYHRLVLYASTHVNMVEKRHKQKIEVVRENAVEHHLRQFRYIYFVDKRLIEECTLQSMKYPKHYNPEEI